jgi:RNA polymerase sigma-70 factor (ECF subfamily)
MENVTDAARPELERLDRRLRSALMAYFGRRIGNRAEAEDLTQEVFSRLAKRSDVDPSASDSYVFRIAANLLNDRARREIVRRDYRETHPFEGIAVIDSIDPFRIVAGRDELVQLGRLIADLPEKTRRIFTLYRIENIDKAAIADSMGLSTRMVEIHIRRALTLLDEAMERSA